MSYDLIGDVHGCASTLHSLLKRLGYRAADGVYRHPARQAVFLGDFIDRGPHQREVLDVVRPMVEAETALAVMGNHEYNAIAFCTPDPDGDGYLRPNSDKNTRQHRAFLDAYGDRPADHAEVIDWFKTLPLWLDLGEIRVIHACWDPRWLTRIREFQDGGQLLGDRLLQASARPDEWQYDAIETILKGLEIALPSGITFRDKDGTVRDTMRVRWWDRAATTYHDAFLGPDSARERLPREPIATERALDYAPSEPPVFVGHYWLEGEPEPLAENVACLDYSVAKPGGKLVAYRFDGERRIERENYRWIDRIED